MNNNMFMENIKLIGSYKNGNYQVSIYEDGTKVRENDLDNLTPAFSENCDVKFTHKCSQGCPFCYEGCTSEGKHSDIMSQSWINNLHPFTELAINGNDMDHPDLEEFLKLMKSQQVIVNITVNQNQFLQNYEKLAKYESSGLVHGVGVSLIHYDEKLEEKILSFPNKQNIVLHTINGILTYEEITKMIWKKLKILILGYKNVRRGEEFKKTNEEEVKRNQNLLYNNIAYIIKAGLFKVVSFDNLAIEQLDVKRILSPKDWEEFYMGDDGQFTFYIDAVAKTFAKNSVISEKECFPIDGRSIDEMFNFIQQKYK